MSIDIRRSHSRSSDLRPSRAVSFNRDVHVKRYGRLTKIEEKPENEMRSRGRADGTEDRTRTREENFSSGNVGPTNHEKKGESLAKRIKQFFTLNKKNNEVKTRYTEYKGEDDRRRPDSRNNWFRSLERTKYSVSDDPDGLRRNLRYFGESDNEASRRGGYFTTERRRSGYATDETDASRYDSLVYLHAPRVRDIPTPRKRHLSRSVSLVGPWTPSHRPISRSGAPLVDSGTQTISRNTRQRHIPVQTKTNKKLPELVFTGPPLDSSSNFRGRI